MNVRDTLFGDAPPEDWPPAGAEADDFPWTAFDEARAYLAAGSVADARRYWHEVTDRPGLESRHYVQAWGFLRAHGEQPPEGIAKDVLGLVVEMALPEGLDLLAVYADRSARYYNHAGGGVALEHAEGALAEPIDELLAAAAEVVARIGPWEGERPGPPAAGTARLSFLTPNGLHFGEGPVEALEADPLGGLVLHRATAVMLELVELGAPTEDGR
jgi:hypothetical protein